MAWEGENGTAEKRLCGYEVKTAGRWDADVGVVYGGSADADGR